MWKIHMLFLKKETLYSANNEDLWAVRMSPWSVGRGTWVFLVPSLNSLGFLEQTARTTTWLIGKTKVNQSWLNRAMSRGVGAQARILSVLHSPRAPGGSVPWAALNEEERAEGRWVLVSRCFTGITSWQIMTKRRAGRLKLLNLGGFKVTCLLKFVMWKLWARIGISKPYLLYKGHVVNILLCGLQSLL